MALVDGAGRPVAQLVVQSDVDGGVSMTLSIPDGCSPDQVLLCAYAVLDDISKSLSEDPSEGGGGVPKTRGDKTVH